MKFFFQIALVMGWLLTGNVTHANLPGGGNGTGPNVTLVNNNNGTVTMANGIVSVLCTTAGASLNQINYTYNNGNGTVTNQLLANGTDGGEFYWETGGFGTGSFAYSVVSNTANYCEMDLLSTSTTNGILDIHFSMLRGSPGFYVTAIWGHRAADVAMGMGETRDNIYAGAIFNWMSVDAARNRLMEVSGGSALGVLNAPVEVSLWTNGLYQGQYEDKYKYSADLGVQRAWGWSSVGSGGANVGLWNVSASAEYYNGGPMKRELMSHIGTTILNMLNGGHYGGGHDGSWNAGEVWTKVYGPYFIYCNNLTNTITDPTQASTALYADAQAQAAAEQTAWPYSWFGNTNYAAAAGRGSITGQMVINDSFNPNASAAGLWVGAIQQPSTTDGVYDFQEWMKPYQFWVKADTNGNFTIPNVIAGANYTLYAFGPGAAGTFQSQALSGGSAANTVDIPATPFSVTVTAGATNNLGNVIWTPTRVGPTVFEIGYPNRTANKFRHGDDFWVGDIGPSPTAPSPIWAKHLEYPFDFPNGPNYIVGQSRWTTDWNFVQPIVTDNAGNFNPSTSTITFNLASAPSNSAQASFYLALSSDYQGPLIIQVNGNNIAGSTGYFPAYNSSDSESDTTIRQGIHGCFSDNRITFPSSDLKLGQNTITINMRKGAYFANHAMYDYLRLELTGYVPPTPATVEAYPGNNANLIAWPLVPGATSYSLQRSTSAASGYTTIASGLIEPVCGSGTNNATYMDTNVVNGVTYYYTVQAANPTGTSTNSPHSSGVTPSASLSSSAPAAPTGLTVSSAAHQSVTLSWNASSGANYYSVWRSTIVNNGVGNYITLGTILLNNTNTSTTFTDTSPTDGSTYSYAVTATSASGTSPNSTAVTAIPLPSPPASAPGSFAGSFSGANIVLNWSPVSGAVGYIVSRATSAGGPYNFLMSVTETTYTDSGVSSNSNYYYDVLAVNAAGVSTVANTLVLGSPIAPGLTAIPGNAQINLNWSAVTAATNYVLQSSTTSGGPYTTLLITTNVSYVNSNLVNGTTYYYVVYSEGPNGQSPLSSQASATPSLAAGGIYWINTLTASAQNWNANSNWDVGTLFPNGTEATAVVNSAIATTQTIDLNQAITIGSLSVGNGGGAFNIAPNTGTLTFDNTPAQAILAELPASKGDTISAPVIVNESLLITNASANTLTLSGNISGSNIVINGNTTFSGTNTYSGGTILNGGNLTFSTGTAIPASGTLTLNNTSAVTVVSANGLPNVLVNGTNMITGNGNSGTSITALNDAGLLALNVSTGSKVFDLTGTMTGAGTLVLSNASMTLRLNGTSGDGSAVFNLGTGANYASVRNPPFAIALGGLAGGSGTFLQGASSANSGVTFTIGGANANTRFDGIIENGGYTGTPAVSVVKTGSGTQTLTGPNVYSGGTTISGGTLSVNNTNGSATGSGNVTVASGGTLTGNGIIAGAVTVSSGGTLFPGTQNTVLTISNNLTLSSGSTTFLQLSHAPTTNTTLRITGTLTAGGALIVTNVGTAALAVGDTFNLLNATSYIGAFGSLTLPALPTGLAWNTNGLNSAGTLSVIESGKPVFGHLAPLAQGISFTGTGGVANATYYLLSATNLTTPTSNWIRLLTNQFDANGNFNFTNSVNSQSPQSFYQIQVP